MKSISSKVLILIPREKFTDANLLGSVGSVRILEGGGPPFFNQFRTPNIIPIMLGVFVKPQDLNSFGGNQPKLLGSVGSVRILEGGGPPFFTQFRTPNIIPIMLGVFVRPQDLNFFGEDHSGETGTEPYTQTPSKRFRDEPSRHSNF